MRAKRLLEARGRPSRSTAAAAPRSCCRRSAASRSACRVISGPRIPSELISMSAGPNSSSALGSLTKPSPGRQAVELARELAAVHLLDVLADLQQPDRRFTRREREGGRHRAGEQLEVRRRRRPEGGDQERKRRNHEQDTPTRCSRMRSRRMPRPCSPMAPRANATIETARCVLLMRRPAPGSNTGRSSTSPAGRARRTAARLTLDPPQATTCDQDKHPCPRQHRCKRDRDWTHPLCDALDERARPVVDRAECCRADEDTAEDDGELVGCRSAGGVREKREIRCRENQEIENEQQPRTGGDG